MKTVRLITDDAVATLKSAIHYASLFCVRERTHIILLSSEGYSLGRISGIYEVQYQTVSQWIDDWERLELR